MLQEPHLGVKWMGYMPEEGSGVYVSRWTYGSPAQKYGLRATCWVVEVNGKPTPDLDSFLEVVKALDDKQPIRFKTRDLDAKPKLMTLRNCLQYFPTTEIRWDPEKRKWHMTRS